MNQANPHLRILPRHHDHQHPNSLSQFYNYQHQQPPTQKASARRFELGNHFYTRWCREATPEQNQQTPESNWTENQSTSLRQQTPGTISLSKPFPNVEPCPSALCNSLGFAEACRSAINGSIFRFDRKETKRRTAIFCLVSENLGKI